MEQFFEFVVNHWVLSGLLVLVVIALIVTETRRGGPSISLHEATRLMNQEKGVVLDLRSKQEFSDGHITGAINIPYSDLASRVSELEKYKQSPLILVCKMGQQSTAASKTLKGAGFSDVRRMQGGMAEWNSASLPLVKGAKG